MSTKIIKAIKPLGFPWATQDPFIFCAYHLDKYPAGNEKMGVPFEYLKGRNVGQDFTKREGWAMYHGSTIPGFPYHPHRGFETITINKQGYVDHTDSLGAAGRFGPGDVQWMTAGKGVQHSEMFPLIHQDKGNTLEIFQIWLNLPRKSKMVEPHFKMLWKNMIPRIEKVDEHRQKTIIDLVAGSMEGTEAPDPTPDSWAADPANHVLVATVKMEPHAQWIMPESAEGITRSLYFYKGNRMQVEGQEITGQKIIDLRSDTQVVLKNGEEDTFLLWLEGRPINEPVVQHGPFVMNSREEIMQAFDDFRRTEFGGWPWPKREQVHHRNKGRFALHADGVEEVVDKV